MAGRKKRSFLTQRFGRLKGWQWCAVAVLGAGLVISCALLLSQVMEDVRTARIIARNRELARAGQTQSAGATPAPEQTAATPSPTATPAPPTPTPFATVTAASAPLTNAGTVDLNALKRLNQDTVGWLTMDSVRTIDFAVVQGNNAYYLAHDFDGRQNAYGTPFLDEGTPLGADSDNLIVYAHNMRNGEMFGELNRVLEDGRFLERPYVHFQTLYGSDDYVPYAVCDISVDPQSENYMQYYMPVFSGPGQFIEYVATAEMSSRVTLPWHAQYGDKLLTLVTCGAEKNERLLVFLRAVRSTERNG